MSDDEARGTYDGSRVLENFRDLLTYFDARSHEELAQTIEDRADLDADVDIYFDAETPVLVLGGALGTDLTFPTTLDDFWTLVRDAESEYVLWADADDD